MANQDGKTIFSASVFVKSKDIFTAALTEYCEQNGTKVQTGDAVSNLMEFWAKSPYEVQKSIINPSPDAPQLVDLIQTMIDKTLRQAQIDRESRVQELQDTNDQKG